MQAVAEAQLEFSPIPESPPSHNTIVSPTITPLTALPVFTDAVKAIALVEPSQTNHVEIVPSGTQRRVPSL